jgi:hypothetical protein
MILDRFNRKYETQTTKSITNIIDSIEEKAQQQKQNIWLLTTSSVNYKKFIIRNNVIEIERSPTFFNPFTGTGTITYEMTSTINGTKITCNIKPSLLNNLITFGFVLLFPIIITVLLLQSVQHFYFGTLLFMLLFWIFPFGIAYFICYLNTLNLESYSKTALYDLEILHPKD